MKAKLFFYGACILAALISWNIIKTGKIPGADTGSANSYKLDKPAQAVRYTNALKCSLNHITVASVDQSAPVVGSNYMAAYKSVIQTDNGMDYSVYLLTDGETGPWAVGQIFAVLGTCEEISAKDLAAERAKFPEDIQVKENECVGAFYWDKETHQVSRQCAQSLGDHFFLGWDNRKTQAPVNKDKAQN